ncbi:MAG: cytochrome c [Candidatus Binatia bacterium]
MLVRSWGVRIVTLTGLMGTLLFGATPGVSLAQQAEVAKAGRPAYEQNCAVCHGREGKGDGGAMNLLTVKPADLTQLSKNNNGTFPFWQMYRVIDGREEIKGHGARDMPIWGQEFRLQSGSGAMAESQARGRILELVYYLESIQAK